MIRTVALLCLLAPAFIYAARPVGFRYRFDFNAFGFGTTNFINSPRTNTSAAKQSWVNVERPYSAEGFEALQLWCKADDYAFCILTDETGNTAGVQISVETDRFKPTYDMDVLGFRKWSPSVNGETIEYYTKAQYFVSADAATRVAYENPDKELIRNDYVTVEGFNGTPVEIAKSLSDLDSVWTKQACVIFMGQHYYYDMSASLECDSSTIMTWFPLYEGDALIGMGFMLPGTYTLPEKAFDHFEHPDEKAVKMIVNSGPQCLYDTVRENGVLTMHVYYIETPRQVLCL